MMCKHKYVQYNCKHSETNGNISHLIVHLFELILNSAEKTGDHSLGRRKRGGRWCW